MPFRGGLPSRLVRALTGRKVGAEVGRLPPHIAQQPRRRAARPPVRPRTLVDGSEPVPRSTGCIPYSGEGDPGKLLSAPARIPKVEPPAERGQVTARLM